MKEAKGAFRMRNVDVKEVTAAVRELCVSACTNLPEDVYTRIQESLTAEPYPVARSVLKTILENARLAKENGLAICQDTGMAVIFLKIGQDVHFVNGDLYEAVEEGVRQGYEDGYLRKSIVADPLFDRVNTGDNTPAVIHTAIVPGDKVDITVAPKGFGSENMSAVGMLKPSDGVEGVINFVLDTIEKAGANACPPMVVGVGIGGNFESCALLAKEAMLRPIDSFNNDERYHKLEEQLYEKANQLGIGPAGFGGKTTVLAVHIEQRPTHIAGLPVAVAICCHVSRHQRRIL